MKTRIKITYLFTFMVSAFLISCDNNKFDFAASDSENVQSEAASDSFGDDADDISSVALSSDDATLTGRESSTGRRITVKITDIAKRLDCATITIETATDNTPDVPKGTITIDFGTGCTDAKGNVRKGIIVVTYSGKRFLPGSTAITTFNGYSINDIKIEGTRTVSNISGSTETAPKFNIVIAGGKTTWPDGTVATRNVNRTREWIRAANPLQDSWIITGTASGTNRKSRVYSMEIIKPLVYKRECASTNKVFIAVEGTKQLTVGDKVTTIDYGDGTCDNKVTITINGTSKEVEVNGDN